MRSEERAGIVAVILLFLWGTLLTEPFHVFTGYLYSVLSSAQTHIGINGGTVTHSLITSVIMAAICVGLLLLSGTRAAEYVPCGLFVISGMVLIYRIIKNREFYVHDVVALTIMLAIIAILHAGTIRKVLLWIGDASILSIAIFIFAGLVTKPIGSLNASVNKFLYINRYQEVDLSSAFSGVLGLPALLWGIVLFVLLILPVVYFCLSKRKS